MRNKIWHGLFWRISNFNIIPNCRKVRVKHDNTAVTDTCDEMIVK